MRYNQINIMLVTGADSMINTRYMEYLLLAFIIHLCYEIYSLLRIQHGVPTGLRLLFYKQNIKTHFFHFVFLSSEAIIIIIMFINGLDLFHQSDDMSSKIYNIASSLTETSNELSQMQQELELRIEYVENLKREADIAESVISLTEEQVKAVQSKINQEIEASNGKNTISSFLMSAFFFVLGLLLQGSIKETALGKRVFGKQDSEEDFENENDEKEDYEGVFEKDDDNEDQEDSKWDDNDTVFRKYRRKRPLN